MGHLRSDQLEQISSELDRQGITFEPLRSELLDHLISDVEEQMEQEPDFSRAWKQVNQQIPKEHLSNIQNETMILLKKQINPVRVFTIISVLILALGTLFKTLHLPGAGMLLFLFFIAAATTLLVGLFRSIYIYRELKGRGAIIIATFLVVTLIAGLVFKVLHLPGAAQLQLVSVIGLMILFPLVSIYFYRSTHKLKDYLIIHLVENNQKNLENIGLVLIGFGMIYNLFSSPLENPRNVGGVMFFIFSVVLIGMYVYTFTWTHFANREGQKPLSDLLLLIFSSIGFISFMMPVIWFTPDWIIMRHLMAYSPMIILSTIIAIHYLVYANSSNRTILGALSLAFIGYPLLRMGIKLEWLGGLLNGLATDSLYVYGIAGFLLVVLLAFWKETYFKALVLLMLASHMIPTL